MAEKKLDFHSYLPLDDETAIELANVLLPAKAGATEFTSCTEVNGFVVHVVGRRLSH